MKPRLLDLYSGAGGAAMGYHRSQEGLWGHSMTNDSGLEVIDTAVQEYGVKKVFALFSGGHDSLVATCVASQHPNFCGVFHLNTGIGIEQTREFVRDTCDRYGWPLYEYHARQRNGMPIYDDMCLRLGMPGGVKAHSSQYHVLKEEGLERGIKEHREGDAPVGVITGIRQGESNRRMKNAISVPMRLEAKLHRAWIAPILDWSAYDVNTYVDANDLQRNLVVDLLHRSGECLCGALARPEELKEIALWFPEVAARIYGLEKTCYENRLPWQWGSKKVVRPPEEQLDLPLCNGCTTRWESVQ